MIFLYICSYIVSVCLVRNKSCGPIYSFNLKTCKHFSLHASLLEFMLMRITDAAHSITPAKVNFSAIITPCSPHSHQRKQCKEHKPNPITTNYLLAAKKPFTLPTTSSSPLPSSPHSDNLVCKAPLVNPLQNCSREIVSLKTEPS